MPRVQFNGQPPNQTDAGRRRWRKRTPMPATMQLAAVPIAGCTYVNVELVCLLTPGENVKIHEARNHYLRGDGDVRRLLSELQDICSEANADGQAIMRRILQLASQPLGYEETTRSRRRTLCCRRVLTSAARSQKRGCA